MSYDYYRLGRVYPRTGLREPYPRPPEPFNPAVLPYVAPTPMAAALLVSILDRPRPPLAAPYQRPSERFPIELYPLDVAVEFPVFLLMPERQRVSLREHVRAPKPFDASVLPYVAPAPISPALLVSILDALRVPLASAYRRPAERFPIELYPLAVAAEFPVFLLMPERQAYRLPVHAPVLDRFYTSVLPYIAPPPMDVGLLVSILNAEIPLWLRLRPPSEPRSTTWEDVAVWTSVVIAPITVTLPTGTILDFGRVDDGGFGFDTGIREIVYKGTGKGRRPRGRSGIRRGV